MEALNVHEFCEVLLEEIDTNGCDSSISECVYRLEQNYLAYSPHLTFAWGAVRIVKSEKIASLESLAVFISKRIGFNAPWNSFYKAFETTYLTYLSQQGQTAAAYKMQKCPYFTGQIAFIKCTVNPTVGCLECNEFVLEG